MSFWTLSLVCIAAFVGTMAGHFVSIWLTARFLAREGVPYGTLGPGNERIGTPEPTGTGPMKRKPFYATPERAAMAEEGRKLPAQWQRG